MKHPLKKLALLALLSTSCQAALVFSGEQNIPIPTSFTGVFIDVMGLNSFTADDPNFDNSDINLFFGGSGIANGPDFQPVRENTNSLSFIVNLPFGTVVDSGSTFGTGFGGSENGHIGIDSDQIAIGEVGFIGFALEDQGNTHYGFMRVRGGNVDNPGEVLDWSYESTPGQAITVVPEPSSTAFLGLCSLALLLRRKVR